MNFQRFFAELKRRNVYKVAYVVAGWALAQGIAQVFPVFDIPNWVVRVAGLLLLPILSIGFGQHCRWTRVATPKATVYEHRLVARCKY